MEFKKKLKKNRLIVLASIICIIVCGLQLFFLKRDLNKEEEKASKGISFQIPDLSEDKADFKKDWKNSWNLEEAISEASEEDKGMEDYELLLDDNTIIMVRGVFLVDKTRFAVIEISNAGKKEKKKLSPGDCIESICIKSIAPGAVEFRDKIGTTRILKIFKENK